MAYNKFGNYNFYILKAEYTAEGPIVRGSIEEFNKLSSSYLPCVVICDNYEDSDFPNLVNKYFNFGLVRDFLYDPEMDDYILEAGTVDVFRIYYSVEDK